jgi:lipoprotein-releasing system ATP-binding protein
MLPTLIRQRPFGMNDVMSARETIVNVHDISKKYLNNGTTTEVLKSVSFEVYASDTLAIVGPSGAGKSTLLNILGTLDKPSSGEIIYRGEDVYSWEQKKIAAFRNHRIGFIFQFHHLLPEFSALENTIMPALIAGIDKKEAEDNAKSLLAAMGLEKRFTHKQGELSGGEQQRVAVARALIMQPELVLADEPTGNLDSQTGEEVFSHMLELNQKMGMTLIVVTHNEPFAKRMSRCITLKDGCIAC